MSDPDIQFQGATEETHKREQATGEAQSTQGRPKTARGIRNVMEANKTRAQNASADDPRPAQLAKTALDQVQSAKVRELVLEAWIARGGAPSALIQQATDLLTQLRRRGL